MSHGSENYQRVVESLRRPSADQMLADIVAANASAIESQKASIAMLRQIIELKDERIKFMEEKVFFLMGAVKGHAV